MDTKNFTTTASIKLEDASAPVNIEELLVALSVKKNPSPGIMLDLSESYIVEKGKAALVDASGDIAYADAPTDLSGMDALVSQFAEEGYALVGAKLYFHPTDLTKYMDAFETEKRTVVEG